jgi:hypothetical protein
LKRSNRRLKRADASDKRWLSVRSARGCQAAWNEEIVRRLRQIDAGEVDCISWDAAMAELRAKFG